MTPFRFSAIVLLIMMSTVIPPLLIVTIPLISGLMTKKVVTYGVEEVRLHQLQHELYRAQQQQAYWNDVKNFAAI